MGKGREETGAVTRPCNIGGATLRWRLCVSQGSPSSPGILSHNVPNLMIDLGSVYQESDIRE